MKRKLKVLIKDLTILIFILFSFDSQKCESVRIKKER